MPMLTTATRPTAAPMMKIAATMMMTSVAAM
jgi:hypothetical protein